MSRELWDTAECSDLVAHWKAERHARAWWRELDKAIDMTIGAALLTCVVLVATYVVFGGWVPVTALLAGCTGVYGVLGLADLVSLCSRGRPLLADKNFPEVPPEHECGAADETEVR